MNHKEYSISELLQHVIDNRGKTPPFSTSGIPLIQSFMLGKGNRYPLVTENTKYVNREIYDSWFRSGNPIIGDVLLAVNGSIGEVSRIGQDKYCVAQDIIGLRFRDDVCDSTFMYYFMITDFMKEIFLKLNNGATRPSIRVPHLLSYKIQIIESKKTQAKIGSILSSLDDKIELNNKINKNLEEIAQTLYKRWFVDFEFPNDNGEPYKSSGGEMVDSELGMIPKGWEVKKQGSYFPVVTGKKNANVATPNGKYKFFTCSQQVYKTDDFSFEGDAILIAGNGDFNVKYYSGKFEAYQRTYVLIPHNSKLSGLLFTAIKFNLSNITTGFRGSVINFITKGHIDDYLVVFPEDDKLELLAGIFKNALETIALNNVENERLTQIRDELLPKLMSGEIEVPVEE